MIFPLFIFAKLLLRYRYFATISRRGGRGQLVGVRREEEGSSKIWRTATLLEELGAVAHYPGPWLRLRLLAFDASARPGPTLVHLTGTVAPVQYKTWQEVMEQVFKVYRPKISLPVPVNGSYPCSLLYEQTTSQATRTDAN